MANKQQTADDGDDDEDDDIDNYSWTKTWGIPDEDSSEADAWSSLHPEAVIVTDSVERECYDAPDDSETPDSTAFA